MDNKTKAQAQFCSNENLQYLARMINWNRSNSDLKETARVFLNNYNGYIDNYHDYWMGVRVLNRKFIDTVTVDPSTATDYGQFGENIFFNEEVYQYNPSSTIPIRNPILEQTGCHNIQDA